LGFVHAGVHYYEGEVSVVGEALEGLLVENDAGAYDGEGGLAGGVTGGFGTWRVTLRREDQAYAPDRSGTGHGSPSALPGARRRAFPSGLHPGTRVRRKSRRVQLGRLRGMSSRPKETDMGRRGGRRGPQGRAQGRVRDRVRGGGSRRGGGESTGRKRGGFDVGAVQDLAGRLAGQSGSGGGSGFSGGGGSGLAGAAAGLASGGLAGRFLGGGSGEEGLGGEDADRLALVEERLQVLEDQMQEIREALGAADATTQDPAGPEGGEDPA
jgi:hypothetical protein